MGIIYKPKGKALEYAPLACNLYNGCAHGCIYCYCNNMRFLNFKEKSQNPTPRKDVVKQIQKELHRNVFSERINLCFTSDPYQPAEEEYCITQQVINLFRQHNTPYSILTKAATLPLRDIETFKNSDCWYGATLTSFGQEKEKWEPNTESTEKRIETLKIMNSHGIKTWASIEPLINSESACKIIEQIPFAEIIWIGKLNYQGKKTTKADIIPIIEAAEKFGANIRFKIETQQIYDN